MTTDERPDDRLPEHERRPETDRPIEHADPESIIDDEPTSDAQDPDPEDPDGPEAAYTPRSI